MRQVLLASDYRISRVYAGTVDADVVIIGNSRAAHLADVQALSEQTCSKVFNLGVKGVDARTQSSMVADYLDRNRLPGLMIVELSNIRIDEASVASEFSPYFSLSDRLRRQVADEGHWGFAESVFSLYAFNSPKWWRALVTWFAPVDQHEQPYLRTLDLERVDAERLRYDWRIGADKKAAVLESLRYALSRGVHVAVTLAPYHASVFGEDPAVGPRYIQSVYDDMPQGVTIADYSSLFSGVETFADRVHINRLGVRRLQPKLVELIRTNIGDRCEGTAATP